MLKVLLVERVSYLGPLLLKKSTKYVAILSMSITNRRNDGPTDIDVYLALRKFNAEGKQVFYTSSLGTPQAATLDWIRASHRTLPHRPFQEIEENYPGRHSVIGAII